MDTRKDQPVKQGSTMRRAVVAGVMCAGLVAGVRPVASTQATLTDRLEALRTQAGLPAVAGAIFSSEGTPEVAAVGVRRLGGTDPVTAGDLWHIGSITKSFTSLLIAKYVERGDLSWTSTLGELVGASRAGRYAPVTLSQLLSHRAGLQANVSPEMAQSVVQGNPPIEAQRRLIVTTALSGRPAAGPGAAFEYSNLGYIIAGAILEAREGTTWEALVQREVLTPLGLSSAGFGPPGELNVISQPRGHRRAPSGTLTPAEPGPFADNPPYLGPAGRLHMTILDLATWGQVHLRGERGQDGIVRADTFKRLHQPEGEATYALGWVVRQAGDTRVTWHNGSNTMWYAIVAFDAAADRGVAIITNGSISAGPAVDAVAMNALQVR